MTTVSQHSFDLASEKGNVASAPTLCRLATELCMYVIAHTFCAVHSRMLLSMFPLLFTAQALRLALYDLASNGDFAVFALYDLASDGEVVAFALYDLASDGDFVVCPCLCYLFGKAFTAARSEFSNLFGYAVVHCRLLESAILSWKADHSGAGSMSSALRI